MLGGAVGLEGLNVVEDMIHLGAMAWAMAYSSLQSDKGGGGGIVLRSLNHAPLQEECIAMPRPAR